MVVKIKLNKRKIIKTSIWFAVVIILFAGLFAYWEHSALYPSTNDAYVEANVVNIAAQVTGPVQKIDVKNNEMVKKGQLLFTIDPKPFQIAVSKAKSQLTLAKQQVASLEAAVQAAKDKAAEAKANLSIAEQNAPRTLKLVAAGQLAKAEGSKAQGELDSAKATYAAAQSEQQQAEQNLGQAGPNNAQYQTAKASLAQAELDLKHTKIYAPAAGQVTNFQLRTGTMVTAQQPQFALIESAHWWVDANFKETDLKRIRPGQQATIKLDIYPGVVFHGHVDSISGGSGSAFSILPPENATGNWVKVTQRFSVKVTIDNPPAKYHLRVGASSTVTIDTVQNTKKS